MLHEIYSRQEFMKPSDRDILFGSIDRHLQRSTNSIMKLMREKNLYKSCILSTEFDRPLNLVRDKGADSSRAGSILTSAGPAWDFGVQLMEHEYEDQRVKKWRMVYCQLMCSTRKRRWARRMLRIHLVFCVRLNRRTFEIGRLSS